MINVHLIRKRGTKKNTDSNCITFLVYESTENCVLRAHTVKQTISLLMGRINIQNLFAFSVPALLVAVFCLCMRVCITSLLFLFAIFLQCDVFFLHLFLVFFCLFLFSLQQMLTRIRSFVHSIFHQIRKRRQIQSLFVSFDSFFSSLHSYRFGLVDAFVFLQLIIWFSFGSFDLNWFL